MLCESFDRQRYPPKAQSANKAISAMRSGLSPAVLSTAEESRFEESKDLESRGLLRQREQLRLNSIDIGMHGGNTFRRCLFVGSEEERQEVRVRVGRPRNTVSASPRSAICNSQFEPDALFKIVLIGQSNSGKTSLLLRFIEERFEDAYLCTIGVDFKMKTLAVDDKLVKVQVWDTAGQERFRSISQAYYRNAHGCIAVYDICSQESFDGLADQIMNFIDYSPTNAARNIVLVGNKSDLAPEGRQVDFGDAMRLARKLGLAGAIETSAKESQLSINDAFYIATVNALDQLEGENLQGSKALSESINGRKRGFSDVPQGMAYMKRPSRAQRGLTLSNQSPKSSARSQAKQRRADEKYRSSAGSCC